VHEHDVRCFKLCDTVPLLAKLLLESKSCGGVQKSPTVWSTFPNLTCTCIVQAGVSITHLTHLNKSERDIARPLTAPSLSKVTLLLMKNVKHPKLITIEIRRSSTIRMSRHHSNTLLREEKKV